MKKYIPNILTTYRLIVSFILLPLYICDCYRVLAILFISAILTDLLDGYLARKWNVESIYGKVADMIGDKFLTLFATLIFILGSNEIFILTLSLELIISLINVSKCIKSSTFKNKDIQIHDSSIYGKVKTWFLFISLCVAILSIKFTVLKSLIVPLVILTSIAQLITVVDYAIKLKSN